MSIARLPFLIVVSGIYLYRHYSLRPKANMCVNSIKKTAFLKKSGYTQKCRKKTHTAIWSKTLSSEALHRMIQQVSWLSILCFTAPSHKRNGCCGKLLDYSDRIARDLHPIPFYLGFTKH
jgi:hypothetical protein